MSLQTQIGPGCNVLRAGARACAAAGAELAGAVAAQAAADLAMADDGVPQCLHRPAVRAGRRAGSNALRRLCARGRSRGARRQPGAADLRSLPGARASCRCTRCWPPAPSTITWCGTGLRCKCNLIIETGTARDPHHFACLIGYGATAVYPYLAFQTLYDMMRKDRVQHGACRAAAAGQELSQGHSPRACSRSCPRWASRPSPAIAAASCSRSSACRRKWWTCASTAPPAASRAPTFDDLQQDIEYTAQRAWNNMLSVEPGGLLKYVHGGEYHMYNPDVIATLQARGDLRQLRHLQGVREAGERAAGLGAARPAAAQAARCAGRRWRKSSRSRRS